MIFDQIANQMSQKAVYNTYYNFDAIHKFVNQPVLLNHLIVWSYQD